MPLNQPQKLATKTWGARIFSHTLLRPQGFSMPKELKPFILLVLLMSCRSVSCMKIETSTDIFDNADMLASLSMHLIATYLNYLRSNPALYSSTSSFLLMLIIRNCILRPF